jgi:hypothetical protein
MNDPQDRTGTLIYVDAEALRRLDHRDLPAETEVSHSRSDSQKKEFQLGIKNILGLGAADDSTDVSSVLLKFRSTDDDLIVPAIIRLHDNNRLVCSLADLPFGTNNICGRSLYVLINARFVYTETVRDSPDARWFLRFRCVEYGDEYNITMGAGEGHTTISYYHVQEIFGDKDPTYLTVFGSATCKDTAAKKFYIKPFAIYLSDHTGWVGDLFRDRKHRLESSGHLVRDFLTSKQSPGAFCGAKGISVRQLEDAISVLDNAGFLDDLIESEYQPPGHSQPRRHR